MREARVTIPLSYPVVAAHVPFGGGEGRNVGGEGLQAAVEGGTVDAGYGWSAGRGEGL